MNRIKDWPVLNTIIIFVLLRPVTGKRSGSNPVTNLEAQPQKNAPSLNVVSSFPTADLQFPGLPYDDNDIVNKGQPNELVIPQVIPPDTMGAVGPSQFVMMINGMLRVFNKFDGSRVDAFGGFDPDLDTFFLPVMTPGNGSGDNYTNFPRIRFDRYSNRWILLANDVPGGLAQQPNRILLAVSDGPVISQATVWSEYNFQPQPSDNPNQFADYPTLGIDANNLYIGANLYSTSTGNLTTSAAYVVKKNSILSGGTIKVFGFPSLYDPINFTGPVAPQGVDNFDSSVSDGYFIGINGATDPTSVNLQLLKVGNSAGITPTISSNITIPISPTVLPLPVPQTSQADIEKLDPIDDRLLNATIQNGSLWTVQHIGVNSAGISNDTNNVADRNGARWYQIDVSTPTATLTNSRTLYDSSNAKKFYWLPSIAVSGQGHAVMGLNIAGETTFVTDAAAGKFSGAADFNDPNPFFASTTYYSPSPTTDPPPKRWGDYSYTSVDPEDGMTFWTIQQFAYNPASYGIQIARLKAPPPASPASASNTLLPATSNQTITINGTSTDGSGFFDPGAGYAKHLNVSIDGEIVVQSITEVKPGSIKLVVSTDFTSPGTYKVTVTNPDGQAADSGVGIVTVTDFTCQTQNVTLTTDTTDPGTLRTAINAAKAPGGCKYILLQPSGTIKITSPLPELPADVRIFAQRACNNKVEIDGSGLNGNPVVGDGLTMNGGYYYGIWLHGFNGRQIVAKTGNNHLRCMKVGG